MISISSKGRLFIASLVACILLAPQLGLCAKRSVEVNLEADFVPDKAVGLVITADSVSERPANNIKQVRDNKFVISVQLTDQDRGADLSISALAIGKDGQRAYADTLLLTDYNSESATSVYNLPYCPVKTGAAKIDMGQIGVFQTLVDYRRKRFELAKLKFGRSLDEETLAELQKLERGFGLSSSHQLNSSLPVAELIERLTRLKATIGNHQLLVNAK